MSTAANDIAATCAACGYDGNDGGGLKTCTACKLVKYCNATCQIAHRPKHKKECKKRAAELKEEALFTQTTPREECDVCMLPLALDPKKIKYQGCCGKSLCLGCIVSAYMADNRHRLLCPFCRTPEYTSGGEQLERINKRIEAGDARSMYELGCNYHFGENGFPQDPEKAMELWLRAAELGCPKSQNKIGYAYWKGEGVGIDLKKANHHLELAAIGGDVPARHNLGGMEMDSGNMKRAMKHWMISAGDGHDNSLEGIRNCFMIEIASKDDFEKALRAHKEAKDEVKSDQREAASVALRDGVMAQL